MMFAFLLIQFLFSQGIQQDETTYIEATPLYFVEIDTSRTSGNSSTGFERVLPPETVIRLINGEGKEAKVIREELKEQMSNSISAGASYSNTVRAQVEVRDRNSRIHRSQVIADILSNPNTIIMANMPTTSSALLPWNSYKNHIHPELSDFIDRKKQFTENIGNKQYANAREDIEKIYYSDRYDGSVPSIRSDGVFLPEKVNTNIPVSPLASSFLKTNADSVEGQVVRRVANKYQMQWLSSQEQLSQSAEYALNYAHGVSVLQMADGMFSRNVELAYAYLNYANEIANGISEFGFGVTSGMIESAKGLAELIPAMGTVYDFLKKSVTNKEYFINATYSFIESTPELASIMWTQIATSYDKLKNGTYREQGEIVGNIAFEVLFSVGTAGSGTVAKRGIDATNLSFKALKLTTQQALGAKGRQAFSSLYRNNLDEIKTVVNHLQTISPTNLHRGVEIYKSLKLSGISGLTDDALAITAQIFSSEEKYIEPLYRIAASQVDVKNRSKYLNNVTDIGKIKEAVDLADEILRQPQVSVAGFESRLVLKKNASTPEQVMNFHEYSKVSQGRFAIGGPQGVEVLSSGFGQTAEEAFAAAKAEVVSYLKPGEIFDINNYTVVTRSANVGNVLDLGAQNSKIVDLLTQSRQLDDSYMLSQILGSKSEAHDITGYLSQSSVAPEYKILHRIKNGK